MSSEIEKKRRHMRDASAALDVGDSRKASFHAAKAGESALKIASTLSGPAARAAVAEARELIEMAESLRARGEPDSPEKPKVAAAGGKVGGSKAASFKVSEKPKVRFSDIAGMEEAKEKLRQLMDIPLSHPDLARKFGVQAGGGVLLYGPPGTGKTTLAKAVAAEMDAVFFFATGGDLRSKWHGESEQNLRDLIREARSHPRAVLFLDEVEGLLPKRGGNSVVDDRIVTQFTNEIGGFGDSENILLLLGATNLPWQIDEAVFRSERFTHKVFVGLPDDAARLFLLKKELADAPCEPSLDLQALVDGLNGFTGSDIVAVVESAKQNALARAVRSPGEDLILMEDFEMATKSIPSSVTPELLKKYTEWGVKRFR